MKRHLYICLMSVIIFSCNNGNKRDSINYSIGLYNNFLLFSLPNVVNVEQKNFSDDKSIATSIYYKLIINKDTSRVILDFNNVDTNNFNFDLNEKNIDFIKQCFLLEFSLNEMKDIKYNFNIIGNMTFCRITYNDDCTTIYGYDNKKENRFVFTIQYLKNKEMLEKIINSLKYQI